MFNKKKNIEVSCYKEDFEGVMRQLRSRLKADDIEKKSVINQHGEEGVILTATVPARRYRKKNRKLLKIADSVSVAREG